MRKFFTLLVMLLSLFTTSEIIATNNQVVAKSTGCTSIDGKGVATFVVTSPQAQVCDLSFLMMPGEYEDGTFTSVTLKVNGVTLPNLITFSTYGWQSANTTGNAVSLNKGDNTIQFISGRDDVPVIKHFKVRDKIRDLSKIIVQDSQIYNKSIDIESLSQKTIMRNSYHSALPFIDSLSYGYSLDHPYSYTTYIPISLSDTTWLSLYAPTANDPMFGPYESKVEYTAYIFNEDCSYSESVSTSEKYIYWQDYILPGNYYVLLEAVNDFGYVTLRINSTIYKWCYASGVTFNTSYNYSGNYIVEGNYNIFTTNQKSKDDDIVADPMLWLKKKISNEKYIISSYNNNSVIPSDFEWDNNARLRFYIPYGSTIGNTPSYSVLLSSANPENVSNEETCNIYYSGLKGVDSTSIVLKKFPNLKYQDAIESSIFSVNYNCIAWSVGITYQNLWPSPAVGSNNILWFDSLYNNQPVHSHDKIFYRPTPLKRYTRDGADMTNAVVALWGIIQSSGDTLFTHASIRNNIYDDVPHGYDWESKMGSRDYRIFHPRDALMGNDSIAGYGEIVAYYKPQDYSVYLSKGIEESIDDSVIIMETIRLLDDELDIIESIKNSIPLIQKNEFEMLYKDWELYVEKYKYSANLWKYKECEQYSELLTYMLNVNNGEYLAYSNFIKGDFKAIILIYDFSRTSSNAKKEWNNIFYNPQNNSVIRTQESEVNLFIKNMINYNNIEIYERTEIYGDADRFNVTTSNNTIRIVIKIEEMSTYSINIVDLRTNSFVKTIVPETKVQAGEYEHSINVPNGNYVVAYYLNGSINTKKVMVK